MTSWTNIKFFIKWRLGLEGSRIDYGPKDIETQEMMKSIGVQFLRDRFYKNKCTSFEDGEFGTFEAGFWTALYPPTADWSSTATQVGGFGQANVINNGDGTVTFRITNVAGAHSFYYHLLPNSPFSWGPMHNIEQVFEWNEVISP